MVVFGQGTRKAIAAIVLAFLIVGGALFGFILLGVGIPDSGKLHVVASFYPLAYFSSQIGGDRVNVYTLIPDNVEPHSFEPTPVDLLVVSKAEVLVFNGEGFEPWIQDFISAASNPSLIQVDTSKNVELLPSDAVKAPYEAATRLLITGPSSSLTASTLSDSSITIPFSSMVVNVTLADVPGGRGGHFKVSVSESADYRFFITRNSSFSIFDNGSEVTPELVLGPLTWYEQFAASGFYELDAGTTYTVSFFPSAINETRFVMYQAPLGQEVGPGHEHGIADPHFWIDPLAAKVQVDNILSAFIEADPGNSTYYQINAAGLNSRLDALNSDFMTGLANRTKSDIVATHEGFNYMATRYHFEAHGAIGISGDQPPTPQDMIRLTDLVNQLQLHYVFSEPVFSDGVIETIAEETDTQVLVLDGVHSRSGVHADMDYFEIMRANLESLMIGLEVAH